MLMPIDGGSYLAVTEADLLVSVEAWALTGVPPGAAELADVAALRTPHAAVVPQYDPTSGIVDPGPWAVTNVRAVFTHPPRSGPITVAGVALVAVGGGGELLGYQALTPPLVSPAPGWTVNVVWGLLVLQAEGA
jgi:hypothetical protein